MSDPDSALSPAALARLTGVSTDTLRHYERKGVLPPAPRTASGYRRYPPASATRVRVIQQALAIGFTLDELARVFGERSRGGAPCRSVRALVGARLGDLDHRLAELTRLRAMLVTLLEEWDRTLETTPAGEPAHLLDTLSRRTSAPRSRPVSRPR